MPPRRALKSAYFLGSKVDFILLYGSNIAFLGIIYYSMCINKTHEIIRINLYHIVQHYL